MVSRPSHQSRERNVSVGLGCHPCVSASTVLCSQGLARGDVGLLVCPETSWRPPCHHPLVHSLSPVWTRCLSPTSLMDLLASRSRAGSSIPTPLSLVPALLSAALGPGSACAWVLPGDRCQMCPPRAPLPPAVHVPGQALPAWVPAAEGSVCGVSELAVTKGLSRPVQ